MDTNKNTNKNTKKGSWPVAVIVALAVAALVSLALFKDEIDPRIRPVLAGFAVLGGLSSLVLNRRRLTKDSSDPPSR